MTKHVLLTQTLPGCSEGAPGACRIDQQVVGQGGPPKSAAKPKERTMSTPNQLSVGDIQDHVRRAVNDGKILRSESDRWTDLLAENPNNAQLLESLAAVPNLNAEPETTSLSAGSSAPVNLSAGDYRQGHPARAPKLFDNGDLPITTASGLDPHTLTSVPWMARKAVARAKTHAEAHALIEKYSGELGQTQADFDSVSGGPLFADVNEYQERVLEWGTWEATDAEANQLTGGPSAELKAQTKAWAANMKDRAKRPAGGVWFYNTDPADPFGYFADRNGTGR